MGSITEAYFKDISKHKCIKHSDLMQLFKTYNETKLTDRKKNLLRNKIATANLRLVISEAKKYAFKGFSLDDLIQEGNIGLMRAIDTFDYRKGFRFSTYARWWIKQSICRYLISKSRTIRLPAHIVTAVGKLKNIIAEENTLSNTGPSIIELSKKLNMSKDLTTATHTATKGIVSLNVPLKNSANGSSVSNECTQDKIDSGTLDPFQQLNRKEMAVTIRNVLQKLNDKEEKVLRLRFGISEDPNDHNSWPITNSELTQIKKQKKGK